MTAEGQRVLAQWEIDSLLGAVGSPEFQTAQAAPETAKNVRPYDFRRPDKFSKEHLRALQTLHESFARSATSSLSSYLRTGIQVRLSSVEQIVFGEYVQQLAIPTVIGIVSAPPLPGHMIVEVNVDLAFALVERLLGGQGQIVQKSREMTDIEIVLLQNLMKNLLVALNDAWRQVCQVNLSLDDLVFNPQIVQAALPADVGVLLLFELRIGESSEAISMVIPYSLIEPVIDMFSSQMWLAGVHQRTDVDDDVVRRQLDKVRLPINVNLGTTAVFCKDLIDLRKGNVIVLDAATNQELQVMVGGHHKYFGRPGRSGRKMAVTITRVVR